MACRLCARAEALPERCPGCGGHRLQPFGWDAERVEASVRSLADRYPPETIVHPGHGPDTTLGGELERNPFLAELRA